MFTVSCGDVSKGSDAGDATGSLGGPCFSNGTCNTGLSCAFGLCVKLPDLGTPDVGLDMKPLDGPVADQAIPDQTPVDQTRPDAFDMEGPDSADMFIPDSQNPDAPNRDLSSPDLAAPDANIPDALVPDFAIDSTPPDLVSSPDQKICPDGGFGLIGKSTLTGSMTALRSMHTATLLPDGRVLVTGGTNSTASSLASAEVFDPTTGKFTATGSMKQSRIGHTATLLSNGKVLIAGGTQQWSKAPIFQSAELYDPMKGSFSYTGNMLQARYGFPAVLLPSGKVLLVGGSRFTSTNSTAELYDPLTGKFTATGSMSAKRASASATLLINGRVLVAGGYCGGSCGLTTAELYDPSTGKFSGTGSLSVSRLGTATLLLTGSVLFAGAGIREQLTS